MGGPKPTLSMCGMALISQPPPPKFKFARTVMKNLPSGMALKAATSVTTEYSDFTVP